MNNFLELNSKCENGLLFNKIDEFRNLINSKEEYSENLTKNWKQLCACMDAIGDSCEAIDSYKKHEKLLIPFSNMYLLIHGVFQACTVAIDSSIAIAHIFKLDLINKEKKELQSLRKIRITVSGHPTTEGKKHKQFCSFIIRGTMTANNFTVLRYSNCNPSNKDPEEIKIDCDNYLSRVENFCVNILDNAMKQLEKIILEKVNK